MKKNIVNKALKALAKAPRTAAETLISELPDEDKDEARRLFLAVGIKTRGDFTDGRTYRFEESGKAEV